MFETTNQLWFANHPQLPMAFAKQQPPLRRQWPEATSWGACGESQLVAMEPAGANFFRKKVT